MRALIDVIAAALAATSASAALVGAWYWWQVQASRAFWILARTAQAIAIALALAAGVAAATGDHPDSGLFWVYTLVPVVLSFVAEQLRLASASTILDARDIASAQEVGELPPAEQDSIVLAIVRREMGVMALAMVALCFLALRALGTAAGV
ncbi:MAG TPA: hypothetical protein VFB41_10665 [Solirubrobacteraceae bacterium]|nr:hypothetical protein [Solirubrobacteraceae bacterium]